MNSNIISWIFKDLPFFPSSFPAGQVKTNQVSYRLPPSCPAGLKLKIRVKNQKIKHKKQKYNTILYNFFKNVSMKQFWGLNGILKDRINNKKYLRNKIKFYVKIFLDKN